MRAPGRAVVSAISADITYVAAGLLAAGLLAFLFAALLNAEDL